LRSGGNAVEAIEMFEKAQRFDPTGVDRLFHIAEAQRLSGRSVDAMTTLRGYLAVRPDDINARSNLGAMLLQAGWVSESAETLRAVVDAAPDHLQAWINLATTMVKLDRLKEAEDAFQRALAIQPGNPLATLGLNNLYTMVVPRWHFVMMNDRRRNEAYDRAITRAIRQKTEATGRPPLVLEIGTGSGLLSMMAARAGAEHVVTCEVLKPVADAAVAIIEKNGLSGRITVHNKPSSELVSGFDLPRKADILVSEIFDAGLLGENVLPAVSQARQFLLADDAIVVPGRATVWMVPIQSNEIHELYRASNDNACGFDLDLFNRFAKEAYEQLPLRRYEFDALAAPTAVLEFDFAGDVPDRELIVPITPTRDGVLHAWAFWFVIDFDGETFFDTGPYSEATCWSQAVQVDSKPRQLKASVELKVSVTQTRQSIRFAFADA
jgi:tetratricopeptide (TPR) repeat protein